LNTRDVKARWAVGITGWKCKRQPTKISGYNRGLILQRMKPKSSLNKKTKS
jgi:hypothetical protein